MAPGNRPQPRDAPGCSGFPCLEGLGAEALSACLQQNGYKHKGFQAEALKKGGPVKPQRKAQAVGGMETEKVLELDASDKTHDIVRPNQA